MQRGAILPARVLGSPLAHTLIVRQRSTLRPRLDFAFRPRSTFGLRLTFRSSPFQTWVAKSVYHNLRYAIVMFGYAALYHSGAVMGLAVYRYSRWSGNHTFPKVSKGRFIATRDISVTLRCITQVP